MSILQCCDAPVDEEFAEKLPSSPYAFPNGLIKEFLADRVKVPEGLFDLNYLRDHPHKVTTPFILILTFHLYTFSKYF